MVQRFLQRFHQVTNVSKSESVNASAIFRLIFTSDGVVVGVVIRSVKRYNLVEIKTTESEAEHWFCLWLRRLIKWKLHCRSRKQKRKNKPMAMFDSGPCDWLVLPLLLPTPTTYTLDHTTHTYTYLHISTHWIIRLRFSIFTWSYAIKRSLMTPTTTPTPSLLSENQPLDSVIMW